MTRPRITVAMRAWDHLAPLAAGDIATPGFDLELRQVPRLPDLLATPELDGAETSLSRYTIGLSNGDDRLIGIPAFVMRAFRHRCILVRRDSERHRLEDLAGSRVGLTGWADTGNTWTRSLLRRAGVDLQGVSWKVGPLTADAGSGGDRIGPVPRPAHVRTIEPADSLVDSLLGGRLDAVMTPFMPPGFHSDDSPLRHLLVDYAAAERAYYRDVGFCPGIHAVALKGEVVDRHPWLPEALLEALETSKRQWFAMRRKLADTTPWMLADIDTTIRTFGEDWMPYGMAPNRAMVTAFSAEAHTQGLIPTPVDADTMFAHYTALAGSR